MKPFLLASAAIFIGTMSLGSLGAQAQYFDDDFVEITPRYRGAPQRRYIDPERTGTIVVERRARAYGNQDNYYRRQSSQFFGGRADTAARDNNSSQQ